MIDVPELVRRIIKYFIEGFIVAIAAFAIPERSLNIEEILALTLTATATFAILDTYIPSIGASTRQGAGLGIGLGLVGW
jgi:ABC-type Co2+ transport system permease subunit